MTTSPLSDLIDQFEVSEEGDRLTQDNHDWAQINAALAEWARKVPIPESVLAGLIPWLQMVRMVVQMAYIFGYRRGKLEANMPEFVVAEEVEA